MKHIDKGPEPPELAAWNLACAGAAVEWDDLEAEVRHALKRALLDEQGHICCYCGRRLVQNDYHIEHLVPRHGASGDTSLTFVYRNLLASCQPGGGRKEPLHCGAAKGKWYEAAFMVSPLDLGCEVRFSYDFDGKVHPATPTDQGAVETIAHLDLDGERLKEMRHQTIEALFLGLDGDLEPEERQMLLTAYTARDAERRFKPFCFVLASSLRALYGDG